MRAAGGIKPKTLEFIPPLAALAGLAARVSAAPSPVGAKVTEISCWIYKAFVDIIGAIASLIFLLAAIKWIMSRNDLETRVRQRETMTNVLIGLVILALVKTAIVAISGATLPPECNI